MLTKIGRCRKKNKGQNGTSHGHPGSDVYIIHYVHNVHNVCNVNDDNNVYNGTI